MDRPNDAMVKFGAALKQTDQSSLSDEVKANNRRIYLFNIARVAVKNSDFATAKAKHDEFADQVEALNNPNQIRLAHQLAGMIALEEEDYDKAIEELLQANQQNPYNLYQIAVANKNKGDLEKASEFCAKAAHFNGLNNINYAFIRKTAEDMLSGL